MFVFGIYFLLGIVVYLLKLTIMYSFSILTTSSAVFLCLHCKYVKYVLVIITRLILQSKIVVLTYISHLPPLICFVCSL